jgi:type I restriction enzyme S subunit
MNDGLKDSQRDAIIAVLKTCPKLERALLFGSRAMGTHSATSDVDIALEGDLSLADQATLAEQMEQLTIPYSVDLVRTQTITSEKLKQHIKQYGRVLYVRGEAGKTEQGQSGRDRVVNKWRTYRLGDVTDWYSGGTPPKAKEEFWDGDIPWISASSMHHSRLFNSDHKVTEESLRNGTRLAKKDSVLLLVRGSTLHQRVPIGIAERDVAFNQDVKAIVSKSEVIDQWYLLYWFLSKEKELLASVGHTGIGAGKLDTPFLKDLEISVPDEILRKQITATLKTLDDKIALNRKLNETLEGMARALFQSWFVDFDPVKAKLAAVRHGRDPEKACMAALSGKLRIPPGKPKSETLTESTEASAKAEHRLPTADAIDTAIAALETLTATASEALAKTATHFPTNFHESELGLIPEGWEVGTLSNIIQLIGGGTPKKSNKDYWNGEIPWFSVKDTPSETDIFVLDTDEKITSKGLKESSTKLLREGTTIISARGTVGRLAMVGVPMAMNQSCYGVVGVRGFTDSFTFLNLRQAVEELKQRTHGAVFDTITRNTFDAIGQTIAPVETITAFEAFVSPLFDNIKDSGFQSRTLAELRDALLPKLLSGELSVGQATNTVEAAVES